MRPVLQSEVAECGLACLAMVCASHGRHVELSSLRSRFPVGTAGANLLQLTRQASQLGLLSRPLKLELEQLVELKTPCILHWDLNHFVVLQRVARGKIHLIDPALGTRKLTMREASRHFTGIALELSPSVDFEREAPQPRLSLSKLTGNVRGLNAALLQVLAVAVVLELFAVAAPLFNQFVIDDVLVSGDLDLLTVLLAGFCLLLLIQSALSWVRSIMVISLGRSVVQQWQSNLFSHLVHLPISFFERRQLGDISSRFAAVQSIQKTLTNTAVETALDGLMAVAALAMMLLYSWRLTLIVLVSASIYGVLRWLAYRPFRDAAAERLMASAREQTVFMETIRAMMPLKLFSREDERRTRWQNLMCEVQARDAQTARMTAGFTVTQSLLVGLENLLVLFVGARLVMSGQMEGSVTITVGMLFAFLSFKTQFSTRVAALINYAIEYRMLALHAERLADIALEPTEKDGVPHADLAHLPASIELRDVSYRYSEGEPWILKNVNLTIAAGESLAITGASGAGKTTLLKIVLGLLHPSEGEVLYGGHPMRRLGLTNVRAMIGTVMQEDVLLTGNILDNITFFDSAPDMERAQYCALLARIHEDIARTPMGYQTLVGEMGAGLSGGQRQRLLLARALYKLPRILALDEATSHLDLANERAVTAQLAQMPMTRVIVAHRPETIAGAQRVVRLEEGRLLEIAVRPSRTAVEVAPP